MLGNVFFHETILGMLGYEFISLASIPWIMNFVQVEWLIRGKTIEGFFFIVQMSCLPVILLERQFVLIDFSHKCFPVLTPSDAPEEILHTELLQKSDLISLSAQLSGKQPISGGEGRDTKRGMVGVCGTPSLCGIHCCPSVGHYFPPWGCRTLKPSGSLLLHIAEMLHIMLFTAGLQCGSHVCAGEYTMWTGTHLEVVLRISPQRWFATCAGRRPVKVSCLEDKSWLRNKKGCLKLLQAASVR